MRTAQQNTYRFQALSPSQFGEQTGQSEENVRSLIHNGWFGWVDEAKGIPEVLDVSQPGGPPRYKIHRDAVTRFRKERACVGKKAA